MPRQLLAVSSWHMEAIHVPTSMDHTCLVSSKNASGICEDSSELSEDSSGLSLCPSDKYTLELALLGAWSAVCHCFA